MVPHRRVRAGGVHVEIERLGTPFGPGPEEGAGGGALVRREIVEELPDLVVEEFLETEAGPGDALLEGGGAVLHEGPADGTGGLDFGVLLGGEGRAEVGGGEVLVDIVGVLFEDALEIVAGPLERVLDLIREILQGTHGNRFLGRIPRRPVVLRQMRHHHLRVALGTQRPALEHGQPVEHAPLVHVQPRLHVVQGRAHPAQGVVELIAEEALGLAPHFFLVVHDIQVGVHGAGGFGARARFELVNVGVPEEELAREVRFFDAVHVRNVDFPGGAAPDPHQRPVFEHLAPDGARPHQKIVEIQQRLLRGGAEHRNLGIVPGIAGGDLGRGEGSVGESLGRVEVEEALDGRELARTRFEDLLSDDPAEGGAHGGEARAGAPRHLAEEGGVVPLLHQFRVEGGGVREDLRHGGLVARCGQGVPVLEAVRGERPEAEMEQRGPVELGEIAQHHLPRRRRGLLVRPEGQLRGLLHLRDVPLGRGRVRRQVPDLKGVRPRHIDDVFRVVELRHAFDPAEPDHVARVEAVAALVLQDADHARVGRQHGFHLGGGGVLPVPVGHGEGRAEVAEDGAEDAVRQRVDKTRALRPAGVVDRNQVRLGQRDRHHHTRRPLDRPQQLTGRLHQPHLHVLVQLRELPPARRRPPHAPPHVRRRQVEVSTQVRPRRRMGVVQRQALDAREAHVLGDLRAQAGEAHEEHVGGHHAALRLVAHHVELPGVEFFVDFFDVAAAGAGADLDRHVAGARLSFDLDGGHGAICYRSLLFSGKVDRPSQTSPFYS
mmetsp:Transcript_17462/g.34756  ORF Transcript_17462/g.34756 Transcript_17462/m.34756 type:complete len:773 (+) Transcript_17462:1249-3567(+)